MTNTPGPCLIAYAFESKAEKLGGKSMSFRHLCFLAAMGLAATGCGKQKQKECTVLQTTPTTGAEVGLRDTTLANDELAQSFLSKSTQTVDTVQLHLVRVGTLGVGETITVVIVEDVNSLPDATILASGSYPVRLIGTTAAFYSIPISSLDLANGKKYWIRLSGSYAVSNTNLIKWSSTNNNSDAYTDGLGMYEVLTTGVWSLLGNLRDFVFKVGNC
jgi:hypothetical protein